MPVTVLLFGPLAAAAGVKSITAEGSSCAALREQLSKNPAISPLLKTARFAVNQSFVPDTHPVTASDEIALIPPVSGGCL